MKTPTALSKELRLSILKDNGVIIANDFSPITLPASGLPGHHGAICLANDSLLRQEEYIEELTSFAISYDSMVGNRLTQLRDFLAPVRPSNSRIVRVTTFDENEPWQTVNYTGVKRGLLADFATVKQRTASKADLEVPNRGLSVILDRDQLKDKPEWQQMHTKWLIDLLNRATILEAIADIEAAAILSNTVWDAASNPDLELKQDIISLANTTGFYPNSVIYGDQAALKRQNAYESQLTAGALARAGRFTEQEIAIAVGVDKCMINAERYMASNSTTKTEIVGSNAFLFTALDESPMDASNVVRHVSNSAYGGGNYAVYVTEMGPKKIILTVENYELLHTQHTTGIQQVAVN